MTWGYNQSHIEVQLDLMSIIQNKTRQQIQDSLSKEEYFELFHREEMCGRKIKSMYDLSYKELKQIVRQYKLEQILKP